MFFIKRLISKWLPRKLKTKLCFLLHLIMHEWQQPAPYPHAENFSGKIPDNWQELFPGVSDESLQEINEFFRRLSNERLLCYGTPQLTCLVRRDFIDAELLYPPENEALKKAQKKYHLQGGIESLIAHHGVAYLPESVHAYLKNKAFVDAGAYIGNYTIPYCKKYTPAVVYAIEPNPKSVKKLRDNLRRNNIPESQVEIFQCALGNKTAAIKFDADGIRCDIPGECETVIRKLDDLLQERHVPVGLIKADVEGMGVELLQGAIKTIERYRPVLALSCYHTPTELFGQFELLKTRCPFYSISFVSLPPGRGWELTMLAVPEVLHDNA